MNSTASYQLQSFSGLVSSWGGVTLLGDNAGRQEDYYHNHLLEAQVRSGDYFVMLATTLDSLSKDVDEYNVRARLEDIVSDLISLQDHYKIIKNDK
jgi:hypothetical protein